MITGLGFITSAQLNGYWLKMLPSTFEEQDNIIQDDGSYGTDPELTVGVVPARNRRLLQISLSFELTPNTVNLLGECCINWRTFAGITVAPALEISFLTNTGEGYSSTAFYAESFSISVQERSLVSVQISGKAWIWEELSGTVELVRLSEPFDPTDPSHSPIPYWRTQWSCPGTPGVCQSWAINFQNNWQFEQLLEGSLESVTPMFPPDPRLVYPGRLDIGCEVTTLSLVNETPTEVISPTIFIDSKEGQRLMQIDIPTMIRVSRSRGGWGEPSGKILWRCSYSGYGSTPTLTT